MRLSHSIHGLFHGIAIVNGKHGEEWVLGGTTPVYDPKVQKACLCSDFRFAHIKNIQRS